MLTKTFDESSFNMFKGYTLLRNPHNAVDKLPEFGYFVAKL